MLSSNNEKDMQITTLLKLLKAKMLNQYFPSKQGFHFVVSYLKLI